MCLIVFAYEAHPRYRLVVAANRDELYARPAEPAHAWGDPHGIVAGRDSEGGGTWLGVTTGGRFAALTNYRHPSERAPKAPDEPSRGALVLNFLESDEEAEAHLRGIEGQRYRGFNLIAGDARGLAYTSNRAAGVQRVAPGFHGLSNHLLDTPWPKVRRGVAALEEILAGRGGADGEADVEAILGVLRDEAIAPDAELPDTGVGRPLERVLSPLFIQSPVYGTRCSTVLLVERSGAMTFVERTHAPEPRGDVRIQIEAR